MASNNTPLSTTVFTCPYLLSGSYVAFDLFFGVHSPAVTMFASAAFYLVDCW